jgi:hypothetical protein
LPFEQWGYPSDKRIRLEQLRQFLNDHKSNQKL